MKSSQKAKTLAPFFFFAFLKFGFSFENFGKKDDSHS